DPDVARPGRPHRTRSRLQRSTEDPGGRRVDAHRIDRTAFGTTHGLRPRSRTGPGPIPRGRGPRTRGGGRQAPARGPTPGPGRRTPLAPSAAGNTAHRA